MSYFSRYLNSHVENVQEFYTGNCKVLLGGCNERCMTTAGLRFFVTTTGIIGSSASNRGNIKIISITTLSLNINSLSSFSLCEVPFEIRGVNHGIGR
jgi:hypothetical protein